MPPPRAGRGRPRPGPIPGPGSGPYGEPYGSGPYDQSPYGQVPYSQGPYPPGPYGAPPPRPRRDTIASGREAPGLGELWYALPLRTRRTAVAALCLALLAGGGYALAATQLAPGRSPTQSQQDPDPRSGPDTALPSAASRRMPYPAQTARITFARLAVSDRSRRTFTVELRATATMPLTVLEVDQGYEAVDLALAGRPPVAVEPGSTRTLLLKAKVTNCDGVPLRARSPFLNVTLRNDRARQELSVIPGERYADALTLAFRTLCRPGGSPAAPAP